MVVLAYPGAARALETNARACAGARSEWPLGLALVLPERSALATIFRACPKAAATLQRVVQACPSAIRALETAAWACSSAVGKMAAGAKTLCRQSA